MCNNNTENIKSLLKKGVTVNKLRQRGFYAERTIQKALKELKKEVKNK